MGPQYKIIFLLLLPTLTLSKDCSKSECIKIADPLIREARLIFPDNMADVETGCRTWNKFVDCLKMFTEQCFNPEQRRAFNLAVESPIENIHQLCMDPTYQTEYLRNAPCIKSTITEPSHCGQHYNQLVEQVAQGDIISKSTLCCSHDKFKNCVAQKTASICDNNRQNGPATQFSQQILKKSLSFLHDQCLNYIPNKGDCGVHNNFRYLDTMTTDLGNNRWSQGNEIAPKEAPFGGPTTPWNSYTTPGGYFASASQKIQDYGTYYTSTPIPRSTENTLNNLLGARARPASYGRANSWSEGATSPPTRPLSSTQRIDWSSSSFNTVGAENRNFGFVNKVTKNEVITEKTSTEVWYPAGGALSNEIDEPNQQGWSNNSSVVIKLNFIAFILFLAHFLG